MCCYNSSCRPSGFLSWMASWLAFPLCPILSAPLALISIVRSVRSGSACAMTRSALLSPFVIVTMVMSVRTAAEYSHGQAVWHQMPKCCMSECSSVTPIGWSVDPKTRMAVDPRRPHGQEIFTWRVSNRVGRALAKVFGPQNGSWKGSLPTPEEAGRALEAGRVARPRDLSGDPAVAAAVHCPPWKGGFDTLTFGFVTDIPLNCMSTEFGDLLRFGKLNDVEIVGTGPDFFVVLDPATHREVARYGEPTR